MTDSASRIGGKKRLTDSNVQDDLMDKLKAFKGTRIKNEDPLIGQIMGCMVPRSNPPSFKIISKIGEGGVGSVYSAVGKDGEKVAIKFLSDEVSENPEINTRFTREATVMNELNHPNVVKLISFGSYGRKRFFAMEHLEGRDFLKDILGEEAIPEQTVNHVLVQACDALGAAHSKGIIHRDIKPENIFLIKNGEDCNFVKILDFGLAIGAYKPIGKSRLTSTNVTFGTPGYMSKEHMESAKNVDGRTDIYSLGVVGYLALCGEFPFGGETLAQIYVEMGKGKPVPPSVAAPDRGISKEMDAIIMKAIELQANDRYRTMEEFKQALLACRAKDAPAAPASKDSQKSAKTPEDEFDAKPTTLWQQGMQPKNAAAKKESAVKEAPVVKAGAEKADAPQEAKAHEDKDHESNKPIILAAIAIVIATAAAGIWYHLNHNVQAPVQNDDNSQPVR